METFNFYAIATYCAAVLTVIAAAIPVYQSLRKVQRVKKEALISYMQSNYNHYCNIARAWNRIDESKFKSSTTEYSTQMLNEMNYIRGICDSARSEIISYCKHNLAYKPTYVHPAAPDEEVPFRVQMGMPIHHYFTKEDTKFNADGKSERKGS